MSTPDPNLPAEPDEPDDLDYGLPPDPEPLLPERVPDQHEPDPVPEHNVETVTPELAAQWLEKNVPNNRSLSDDRVARLSEVIKRGEWRLNGEAIKFAEDDTLIDGQHRLAAVVDAGLPIQTLVIRGLPPQAFDTLDRGRSRTVGDVLKLHGESNTTNLAATINRLYAWERGDSAIRAPHRNNVSPQQALAVLEAHPELRELVQVAGRVKRRLSSGLSIPVIAACLYRFDQLDHRDNLEFWRQVSAGDELKNDDPTFALRRIVLQNRVRRQKFPALVLHALVIKAWNAFRQGQSVKLLSWRASTEKFPEPI